MNVILFKNMPIAIHSYLEEGVPMVFVDEIFMHCKLDLSHLVAFNEQYKPDNHCPEEGDPEDLGYYVAASVYDVHEYLVTLIPSPFQKVIGMLQTSLLKVVGGYWNNFIYDQDFTPTLTINPGPPPSQEDREFVNLAAKRMIHLLQVASYDFDHMRLCNKSIHQARQNTHGDNLLVNVLMWYIPRTSDGAVVLSRVRELVWAIQKTNQSESSLFAIQWAIADLLSLDEGAYEDIDMLETELFMGILLVLREFVNG